ncbi:hypothetical protein BK816_07735 [Boudabousia tangfeifanii]|uniref:Uncharacterized protein n=1 Tax=Boudabousia tangfeifanii TaxID=1912795 RepID=A0A1D9MLY7_9ACTO|nr:DUF5684 domain-containing protein [Boudabousia tangfeifanii]AOZ73199.1 hypothetical protein BK816_07735 [Boudabousia tangfeifanii]
MPFILNLDNIDEIKNETDLLKYFFRQLQYFALSTWLVTNILLFILSFLGFYLVFKKVGFEEWKAFIPFYRLFIISEIIFGSKKFAIGFFIPIINFITAIIFAFKLAQAFNANELLAILTFFFPSIGLTLIGLNEKYQYKGVQRFPISLS